MTSIYTFRKYIPFILSIFKDTNQLEKMDTNKEVISRLKFLGKINKHEKINVRGSYPFVQSDDMATRLSRTFYNKDNRGNTLNFIRNTIGRSFEIVNTYIDSEKLSERVMCCNIIKDLNKAKKGIANLKETYILDIKFCCDLDTILQDIDAHLKEMDEDEGYEEEYEEEKEEKEKGKK